MTVLVSTAIFISMETTVSLSVLTGKMGAFLMALQ